MLSTIILFRGDASIILLFLVELFPSVCLAFFAADDAGSVVVGIAVGIGIVIAGLGGWGSLP